MFSVIIPAHNEANVIVRGLRALTNGAQPGELEVIVVANGCTDDTAQRARAFAHPDVRVIESEVGSKVHALNLGDQAATIFPRFYVDGDVVLTLDALRGMAKELEDGQTLAIAPLPQVDLTGCSWPVRAFYEINGQLPSSQEGIGGSGVYGLSQAGRSRFGPFPRLTADDGFVRVQFRPDERKTLASCRSIVSAPKTLNNLIAIKTRSHFGSYELHQLYPELWRNRGNGNRKALVDLSMRPSMWPKLGAYALVKVTARLRAKSRIRAGRRDVWERDQTSRIGSPVAEGR